MVSDKKDIKSDQERKVPAIFTDPDLSRAFLQENLPGFSQGHLVITDCRVGHSRHKRKKRSSDEGNTSISICYHLNIMDPLTKRSGTQILYAKSSFERKSTKKIQDGQNPRITPPRFGKSFIHLSDLDMDVWVFPNDPTLSHLPEVIDPEVVKQSLFYDLLPKGLDSPDDVKGIKVEVVNYRPEVRCMIRCHLQTGRSDQVKTFTLFGKTFKGARGRNVYNRIQYLWQRSLDNPDSFIIAKPLGYNEAVDLVWQEGLPGIPLKDLINPESYPDYLTDVAKGLADFHKTCLSSPFTVTLKDNLIEIRKKYDKLIASFPQFREPLYILVQELEKSVADLGPIPQVLIHNDFHINQLTVNEGRIALFDFDEFAVGDPLQDLANFIADLSFLGYDKDLMRAMTTTFIHSYVSHAEWNVPADRLNWHIKVRLITKAYRFYIQQIPDLESSVQEAISLAQEGIGSFPNNSNFQK